MTIKNNSLHGSAFVSDEAIGNGAKIGNDSALAPVKPRNSRFPVCISETGGNGGNGGNEIRKLLIFLRFLVSWFPTIYFIYREIEFKTISLNRNLIEGGVK